MDHGYRKTRVLMILVFAFGLMLQGAARAEEKAASTQPMTTTSKDKLRFLAGGPVCTSFVPADRKGNQTVSISIDRNTTPPSIEFDSPKCVEESRKGSLTFKVANLPTGYQLEIDFQTKYDDDLKPHKGPFKFKTNKPSAKYPVAGRCMMSKSPSDSCVFNEHNTDIPLGWKFRFTVFLWDEFGNLADEEDPGVMVVDTP